MQVLVIARRAVQEDLNSSDTPKQSPQTVCWRRRWLRGSRKRRSRSMLTLPMTHYVISISLLATRQRHAGLDPASPAFCTQDINSRYIKPCHYLQPDIIQGTPGQARCDVDYLQSSRYSCLLSLGIASCHFLLVVGHQYFLSQ
jgi:hypothetical protein